MTVTIRERTTTLYQFLIRLVGVVGRFSSRSLDISVLTPYQVVSGWWRRLVCVWPTVLKRRWLRQLVRTRTSSPPVQMVSWGTSRQWRAQTAGWGTLPSGREGSSRHCAVHNHSMAGSDYRHTKAHRSNAFAHSPSLTCLGRRQDTERGKGGIAEAQREDIPRKANFIRNVHLPPLLHIALLNYYISLLH